MKSKFWMGFIIGITGLIIAFAFGDISKNTKEEKKEFFAGWIVGTICLLAIIGVFVGICVSIERSAG